MIGYVDGSLAVWCDWCWTRVGCPAEGWALPEGWVGRDGERMRIPDAIVDGRPVPGGGRPLPVFHACPDHAALIRQKPPSAPRRVRREPSGRTVSVVANGTPEQAAALEEMRRDGDHVTVWPAEGGPGKLFS